MRDCSVPRPLTPPGPPPRRCMRFEDMLSSLRLRDGRCDAAIGAITNSIEREQQGIQVGGRGRVAPVGRRQASERGNRGAPGPLQVHCSRRRRVLRATAQPLPTAPLRRPQFSNIPTYSSSLAGK